MTMHIGKFEGSDWHVIYQHGELIELLEWQRDLCTDTVGRLLRDCIPVDRWDHENFEPMAGIVQMAFIKMRLGQAMPLLAFNAACREFAMNLFDAWDKLAEGQVLLINHNGGFRPAPYDQICDGKEFTVKPYEHLTVVKGSRLLVLENDPTVDEWTLENLHAPYSFIVNLGRLSQPQTFDLMRQFRKETGGSTLFVYTTGINRNQMVDYTEAAIKARFKRIIWIPSIRDYRSAFKQVQHICDEAGIENDVIANDVFDSRYLEEALTDELPHV